MGYMTIGILVLTAIALLFGTLFGMKRGRNRSILRLILIIGCVVGAIFLRPVLTEIIMELDTGEGTLAEMLASSLNEGEQPIPASMQTLVFALIEIIFGLVSYFIVFFALRFVSWLIIFPICKIFVKKDLIKKRGWGALIGLVQGIVIAFAVVVPLNGLTTTVYQLSKIEMEGKPMIEMPAEVGLDKHQDSLTYSIYDTIGGWYYDILTTAENKDGDKLSLDGTCGILSSMLGVGNGLGEIGTVMETLSEPTSTNQQKYDALKKASKILKDTANSMKDLDADAKKLFNEILADLKDLVGAEPGSEEMFENLSIEKMNLGSVANCLDGIANYIDKTKLNPAQVSQEDVDKIIKGFAQSEFFVDMIIGDGTGEIGALYEVESIHMPMFATAVSETDLTPAQKVAMLKIFGINI